MIQFVLNKCYGGFCLSDAATAMLPSGTDYSEYNHRSDAELVEVVEALGPGASGRNAELSIVEIPDGTTDYEISEDNGFETLTYVVRGKIRHC